jgi:hypothetical protein
MRILINLLLAQAFLCISAVAEVETYGPTSLRYEIALRFVVTETTGGARAKDFGNATQRAYIQAQMDKILAQFGASVKFPTNDSTWVSDYGYEGTGVGNRTTSDLNWIFTNIPVDYYQPDDGVVTVVFCERTPGFDYRGFYDTNGYAYIGGNGITFFLGDGMLQNNGNMDIVAAVLAHELGHNLDLPHVNSHDNLMNSTIYEGYLESNQTGIVIDGRFTHGFFAQFGPPELLMSRNGNELSFKYLRSTDGIEQFVSSTLLQPANWGNESSSLNDGIFHSNPFSIASAPQRFFRVEKLATSGMSASRKVLSRAYPPQNCEMIGCSAAK